MCVCVYIYIHTHIKHDPQFQKLYIAYAFKYTESDLFVFLTWKDLG